MSINNFQETRTTLRNGTCASGNDKSTPTSCNATQTEWHNGIQRQENPNTKHNTNKTWALATAEAFLQSQMPCPTAGNQRGQNKAKIWLWMIIQGASTRDIPKIKRSALTRRKSRLQRQLPCFNRTLTIETETTHGTAQNDWKTQKHLHWGYPASIQEKKQIMHALQRLESIVFTKASANNEILTTFVVQFYLRHAEFKCRTCKSRLNVGFQLRAK